MRGQGANNPRHQLVDAVLASRGLVPFRNGAAYMYFE